MMMSWYHWTVDTIKISITVAIETVKPGSSKKPLREKVFQKFKI